MANFQEFSVWEGIYQLERTDKVDAGVNGQGLANRQLANRTLYLKQSAPTFIIDSNANLRAWINNTAGNDYTSSL